MAGAPLRLKQALNWSTMAEKQVTTATAALQCARDELEALQTELEKAQKACVTAEQNMAHAVQQVTGKRVTYRTVGRRQGDPPVLVAKADRAYSLLGWKPAFFDIQATISTAWNWHHSQSNQGRTP